MNGHYVFLKLSGTLHPVTVGDKRDKSAIAKWAKSKNYMIIESFNFGMRRSGAVMGGGSLDASGRASFFDVPVSKRSCAATAELMKMVDSGESPEGCTAEFFMYIDDPSGKNAVDKPAITFTLHDFHVIAVDVGADDTDQFAFSYGKVEWDIFGQKWAEEVG